LVFLVVLLVALGFGSDPAPAEAAPFRCTVTRNIVLPSHEAVALTAEQDGPGAVGQGEYGVAFPNNCQDKLKIGAYAIDLTLQASLRSSSGVGSGLSGARVFYSVGVVRAAEASMITTSSLRNTLWPYYAQADNADFSTETTFVAAACYVTACTGRVRVTGVYSFAALNNVFAVYAVLDNCVVRDIDDGLADATPCDDGDKATRYLPGLEGAQLVLSATATITPLYEVRR
jgi:hypothetical protein